MLLKMYTYKTEYQADKKSFFYLFWHAIFLSTLSLSLVSPLSVYNKPHRLLFTHLCAVEIFINSFFQCVFSIPAAAVWVNMCVCVCVCVCLTCEGP